MVSIAICDDNALLVENTSKLITELLGDAEHSISKFTSGRQLLNGSPFDIVFLDIEMDGMDGLETARQLRERGDECKLVFLTAHSKYVFSTFDVEASHYLVKPPEREKLKAVLLKLVEKITESPQKLITVRKDGGINRIPLSEIFYIEVLDRKVFIHTKKETYDFYGKLETTERELPDIFFRCHRSFIVNLSCVRRYIKNEIVLANGASVPLAKRKQQEFGQVFLRHLKKGGELL